MALELEDTLIELLNEYLEDNSDINFDDRYEVSERLYDFLDERKNVGLCDIEEFAKLLLKEEIKKEAKAFLIGLLNTMDNNENLSDSFDQRKAGSYSLDVHMIFRPDTQQIEVFTDFDDSLLSRWGWYRIADVVIQFDYR